MNYDIFTQWKTVSCGKEQATDNCNKNESQKTLCRVERSRAQNSIHCIHMNFENRQN